MRYDRDRQWVRNVLKTVDVSNTFNGGMSQPRMSFKIYKDHYKVEVVIPGVQPYDFNADIINEQLVIYHNLTFGNQLDGVTVPHVVGVYKLRKDVDVTEIYGQINNGVLELIMPRTTMKEPARMDRTVDIYS